VYIDTQKHTYAHTHATTQGIYGVPHSTLEYKVKERSGTLKTPPKKKLRLPDTGLYNMTDSGTGSCKNSSKPV